MTYRIFHQTDASDIIFQKENAQSYSPIMQIDEMLLNAKKSSKADYIFPTDDAIGKKEIV